MNVAHLSRRGAVLVSVLVLAAGCGNGSHHTSIRDEPEVRGQVAELSAEVADIADVKGRTSENAPPAQPRSGTCGENDPEGQEPSLYQVSQSWSLNGVSDSVLGLAMARLGERLPEHGWKVVQNGPNHSAARDQEILAEHTATKVRVDITWERARPDEAPLINFYISSVCFRDSAGG